jgi:hypothetical protein
LLLLLAIGGPAVLAIAYALARRRMRRPRLCFLYAAIVAFALTVVARVLQLR